MANKNFAQFPAYGSLATGNPVNGAQQWLVGYNETTGEEVKTKVQDMFTFLNLASGINMSFGGGVYPGIDRNLFMGGGNSVFYPDDRVKNNYNTGNGGMFTNIVFASYTAVSGQGGLIFGHNHRYITGTQSPDSQYFARMHNLVLGQAISLSADFSPVGNIFAGAGNTMSVLSQDTRILTWSHPVFASGTGNIINVLSSSRPYVGQMTNGNQLSGYYGGGGCPILQMGSSNEINSTAEGGYINNSTNPSNPNDQYGGIFQMGWGSKIYGAASGIGQFGTGASTISGRSGSCFQFGGYGNMIVESEGVYMLGGNNNYICNAGNCGHGGTINAGAGNKIGNVVHKGVDGSEIRAQNSCGSLLNIGQNNILSIDDGTVVGNNNDIWATNTVLFGNNNKIGVRYWRNNQLTNAGSPGVIFGNDHCVAGNYDNYRDGLFPTEALNLTVGTGISASRCCASTFIGTSGTFDFIGGGLIFGHGHNIQGGLGRPIVMGSNVKLVITNGQPFNDVFVVALDRENINRGSYTTIKRSEQFLLSARGGTFIPGKLGIGIDTCSVATSAALHVNASGNIIFSNLPTSNPGLPTGSLWNNSGVLSVAP